MLGVLTVDGDVDVDEYLLFLFFVRLKIAHAQLSSPLTADAAKTARLPALLERTTTAEITTKRLVQKKYVPFTSILNKYFYLDKLSLSTAVVKISYFGQVLDQGYQHYFS